MIDTFFEMLEKDISNSAMINTEELQQETLKLQ
jgi:hypothetical protein